MVISWHCTIPYWSIFQSVWVQNWIFWLIWNDETLKNTIFKGFATKNPGWVQKIQFGRVKNCQKSGSRCRFCSILWHERFKFRTFTNLRWGNIEECDFVRIYQPKLKIALEILVKKCQKFRQRLTDTGQTVKPQYNR